MTVKQLIEILQAANPENEILIRVPRKGGGFSNYDEYLVKSLRDDHYEFSLVADVNNQ